MSRRSRRHQECLRRIERLERLIWPEWFTDDPAPEDFDFSPGAVWAVGDPGAVYLWHVEDTVQRLVRA